MPNWIKIRTEYETTNISQRKLSEKHKVSYNTLKDRANREQWAKSKEATHIKIANQTHQKAVVRCVDRNTRHLDVWDKLLGKIDILASQEKVVCGFTEDGKEVSMDISARMCVELATALDKIQKGQRLAEGLDKQTEGDKGKLDELITALSAGGVPR